MSIATTRQKLKGQQMRVTRKRDCTTRVSSFSGAPTCLYRAALARAARLVLEIEVGRQTAGRQRAKKPQTAPQHVFQLWSKHKIPPCSNPNPTINSPPTSAATACEPATSMKFTFSDLRGAEGAGIFLSASRKFVCRNTSREICTFCLSQPNAVPTAVPPDSSPPPRLAVSLPIF